MRSWLLCLAFFLLLISESREQEQIGFHTASFDNNGNIEAWTSPFRAASMLVNFYRQTCKTDRHGYPVFVVNTFLNENCSFTDNPQIIPGTHLGMGLLSFVKYAELLMLPDNPLLNTISDLNSTALLEFSIDTAMHMADYLVRQSLTPVSGSFASVVRSSGVNVDFPLTTSAQADIAFGRDCTEPDKAGIAGHALVYLYQFVVAHNLTEQLPLAQQGLDLAVHIAKVLASTMTNGTKSSSPWGFRVDSVTGEVHQKKSANMAFILRLFQDVTDTVPEVDLTAAYKTLWQWISTVQIPAPFDPRQSLWVNFYEDILDFEENDRSSWAPLELARYLLEQQDNLDANWQQHVETLFDFALTYFAQSRTGNVTVLGEQDHDHKIWGGTCSKLASVAAHWASVGGPSYFGVMASNLLNYMTYFVDSDGTPSALLDTASPQPKMGWQQDSLTDVLHNYCETISFLNLKPSQRLHSHRGAK